MRKLAAAATALVFALGIATGARAQQAKELRIAIQPGILFFPMLVMQQAKIAEQLAARTGQADLKITWNSLLSGGANADALLAGNVDVVAGGTSNLLIIWAKSKGAVKAISAVTGVPNVLLTRDPNVKSLKDFSEKNRIAVPTLKVSLQAIYLQMALDKEFGELQEAQFHHGADGPSAGHHRPARPQQPRRQPLLRPALHADGAEEPQHPPRAALPRRDRRADQPAGLHHGQVPRRQSRSWSSCS